MMYREARERPERERPLADTCLGLGAGDEIGGNRRQAPLTFGTLDRLNGSAAEASPHAPTHL